MEKTTYCDYCEYIVQRICWQEMLVLYLGTRAIQREQPVVNNMLSAVGQHER